MMARGGIVVCFEECTKAGGPWPAQDPNAVVVPPSALMIRMIGAQDTVFQGDTASIYSATIAATNTTARPLVIALPPSGDVGPPVTFAWSIEASSRTLFRGERLESVGSIRVAAGETKRWIVDLRATDLSVGLNEFSGSYADVTAAKPARVVVMP